MQRFKKHLFEKYGKVLLPHKVKPWRTVLVYEPAQIPCDADTRGKWDGEKMHGTTPRQAHARDMAEAALTRYQRQQGGHYCLVVEHQFHVQSACMARDLFRKLP